MIYEKFIRFQSISELIVFDHFGINLFNVHNLYIRQNRRTNQILKNHKATKIFISWWQNIIQFSLNTKEARIELENKVCRHMNWKNTSMFNNI